MKMEATRIWENGVSSLSLPLHLHKGDGERMGKEGEVSEEEETGTEQAGGNTGL